MLKILCVLMLLNISVNSYGHAGTVASDFVGLLPDSEMDDTSSLASLQYSTAQINS